MENTLKPQTLAGMLSRLKDVQDKGITFIQSATREEFLSYHQLYQNALSWLAYLQEKGLKPGDELVFQVDDNKTFVQFFWACILGGIIPVPVSITHYTENARKLIKIVQFLERPFLLTGRTHYEKLCQQELPEEKGSMQDFKHVLFLDEIKPDGKVGLLPEIKPEQIAFIQFSSGSTGNPKGVVLEHRNLVDNVYPALKAFKLKDHDSFFSWMPLTHDMGLIAFHLNPVGGGVNHYLMPTDLFVRHPLLWMQKASDHSASITCSPNFGYRYYLNQFSDDKGENLDLSSIRIILNGAEPIAAPLFRQFNERMAAYGLDKHALRAVYGLAEATVEVSFPGCGTAFKTVHVQRESLVLGQPIVKTKKGTKDSLEVACVGAPIDLMNVQIKNEKGEELPEGHMGIISIKGNSVMSRYYNNDAATNAVFFKDGWLNTGDTGFLIKGEIYVVGRVKDIIFLNGANVYPHDIEHTLETMEGIESGKVVACGVPDEETGSESIVVFTVHKTSVEKFMPLAAAIKKYVATKMGLEVRHVLPIRKVLKTTSGKVRRHLFTEEYNSGVYDQIISEMQALTANPAPAAEQKAATPAAANDHTSVHSADVIRQWLQHWLKQRVHATTEELTTDKTFSEYGLTSMQTVQLAADLEIFMQSPIDNTIVYNFPTIRSLSTHLSGNVTVAKQSQPTSAPATTSLKDDQRIAVVGIGCRLPGNVNSPASFWSFLTEGRNAIAEVPAERWNAAAYYNQDPQAIGKMYTTRGGFISHADHFDPLFFGISPREAAAMDPQQRLLLEVTWEALENAGIAPANLRGSESGVFIGMGTDDYQLLIQQHKGLEHYEDVFSGLGIERSVAAGRIAYLLDFHGPVVQLDTACSSSLLSVHQAAQSLLNNECTLALAGGVNLMLSPDTTVKLCRMQALSPTGQCKTFDDKADGYVRGEGAGVVVLKRYADAVAAGDNILAVISGSAVNHDGQSNGLAAPNGVAQQQLIEKALSAAGLKGQDIQYVETHGTGTRLGDPVEVQALQTVYGKGRQHEQSLLIGALKSNIGHLEAAAGVAGLIKTILSLQHGLIPASLHFDEPNRFIPWKDINIKVANKLTPWPAYNGTRRAAVSAFGLSGTNVHVILEAAPAKEKTGSQHSWPSYPFVLSAKSPQALQALVAQYIRVLGEESPYLPDLAYNTAVTRDAFRYRLAFEATNIPAVQQMLQAYAGGTTKKTLLEGTIQEQRGELVWLFTGQGAQYWQMGKELYESSSVFKTVIDRCDEYLKTKWPHSLVDLLYRQEQATAAKQLRETGYAQPALFAVECALAELWKSWGVSPNIVAGHSAGEYAAAYVAGVFTLEDGLRLITERALLMQALNEPGAMYVVFAAEALVLEMIRPYGKDVAIAAINGPELTVISGKRDALSAVTASLKEAGVGSREMAVSHAFHSSLMEPMVTAFRKIAESITLHTPTLKLISNVTGDVINDEIATPDYWIRHILSPVLFSKSIRSIRELGGQVLMELGPQPSLLSMAQLSVPHEEEQLLASMQQGQSSWSTMLYSLMSLYIKGFPVQWPQFFAKGTYHRMQLPVYPFQRQRHWIEIPEPTAYIAATTAPVVNNVQPAPIAAPAGHQLQDIIDYLTNVFGSLLKMEPADINIHARFFELGADSLVLASAVRRVEKHYGLNFSIRLLFEELTSLHLMASYILAQAAPPAPVAIAQPQQLATATAPFATTTVDASGIQGHFHLLHQQFNVMAQQFQWLSQQVGAGQPLPLTAIPAVAAMPVTVPANNGVQLTAAPQNGVKQHKSIFPKMETKPVQTGYTPEQETYLASFIQRYTQKTRSSKELTQHYRPVLADNRASAGFRFSTKEILYPIIGVSSSGSRIVDADGNSYVDIAMGFGVNLLGHRPPAVTAALQQQLDTGYQLGPQTSQAGEVATLIAELTGMERVSFHNSGTEAVMTAVRLARTVTGRNKVAIFAGSYHGHFDGTLAVAEDMETGRRSGVPMAPGIVPNMVTDLIVFDYTDPDVVSKISQHAHELAAVLVEPVQSRKPGYQPKALLQALREMTAAAGIALIFDEMITGFRIHPGGAQAHFGVRADIATYGKIIGGGLPIGVIAGSAAFMNALDGGNWQYGDHSYPATDTTFFAGTFCKHPLSLTSALALLKELKQQGPALQERLNARTAAFIKDISTFFSQEAVPMQVHHFGSLFYFAINTNMDLFFYHLLEKGVYVWEGRTCFLSTAHSDEDVAFIAAAIKDSIKTLQREGFLPLPDKNGRKNTPAVTENLSALPVAVERPAHIPLSFGQERLWFIDQLKGSIQYHVPHILRLKGVPDINALGYAFRMIVNRHEVLRTVIEQDGGHPYQHILGTDGWEINVVDGTAYANDPVALQAHLMQLISLPFNMAAEHLFRAYLVRISDQESVLLLLLHHIVADGWSLQIVVQELMAFYDAHLTGRTPQLKPLTVQYADYAIWQRAHLDAGTWDRGLAYWEEKMNGLAPLNLPTDYARPVVQSTRGAMHWFRLDKQLHKQLQQLAGQQGASLFMTMLAAFKVLLYRYSGQDDICVGTSIAGRMSEEVEELIGFFVNTLALRSDLSDNPTFTDLLRQVKQNTLDAYDHQDVPFERIVEAVEKERDMSRTSFFQVMFELFNTPDVPELKLGNLSLTEEKVEHTTSLFDLSFCLQEDNEGLLGYVEYCIDLFSEATIVRMVGHFEHLLRCIIQQPQGNIASLSILREEEKHQILVDFNNNLQPYPDQYTFIDLISVQAGRTPDATAVVFDDTRLTYRQLEERSNQIAHHLRNLGVTSETLVPICIERSLNMIAGIIGIMKAGGVYIPIDPEYPADRISYMLDDSDAKWLVTSSVARQKTGVLENVTSVLLDTDAAISTQPVTALPELPKPANLAYVIYTSGSTGKPKGAMVEHAGMLNHLYAKIRDLKMDDTTIQAYTAAYTFDISVWQMFAALLHGGRTIIYAEHLIFDPVTLINNIDRDKVTILELVPSYLASLLQEETGVKLNHLRYLLVTGEAVSQRVLVQWFNHRDYSAIPVVNAYGPTEASDDITHYFMYEAPARKNVPLGKPIQNLRIYILDQSTQLCPIGVAGEICVSGVGVGRGYLKRPALTAERFLIDPFQEGNVRLYRTGDLGRWLPDGTIECLGRIDDQVKVRGYRIELGEIESVLQQSELVNQAVVLAKEDNGDTKRLVSFYVPDQQTVRRKEEELYNQQRENWHELWETEYARTQEEAASEKEFNLTGWNDSFTGKAFPQEHMRIWLEESVKAILAENPTQLLELGCGAGLLYYRLADHLQKYVGMDFSSVSVGEIRKKIESGDRQYPKTVLKVGGAHEIEQVADEEIDMVVINSVAQYFPGEKYLSDIFSKTIPMLRKGGKFLLGDIRDQRLLKLFKSRIQLAKFQDRASIKEFTWGVDQEILKEEELLFTPAYFYHLRDLYPDVTHIDIQLKKGNYINELTLYRYTVVIYVNVHKPVLRPEWQYWDQITDRNQLLTQVAQRKATIALKDVPNPRIWRERLLEKGLREPSLIVVGDLAEYITHQDEDTLAVQQLLDTAEANGYHIRCLVDEDPLKINLLLEQVPFDGFIEDVFAEQGIVSPVTSNIPLFGDIAELLQQDIRRYLQGVLPDYMIPADFTALQHLPLTVNGKVDRKFLLQREDMQRKSLLNYQLPVTVMEQQLANIWQTLLGAERIGVRDNFFEIGGHSLLAIRVVSAIRKELGVELTVKDFFLYPTIGRLALYLQVQDKSLLMPAIEAGPRPARIPLSFSQERLWFIDQLEGSVQYHVPAPLRLRGKLDETGLAYAIQTIVNRHEVLRSVMEQEDGPVFQRILEKDTWKMITVDGEAYAEQDALEAFLSELIHTPFDLSKDHMLRAYLIRLSDEEHMLLLMMHHIVSDGWSLSVLVRELIELYSAYVGNREAVLEPLPIQYADFSIWQRKYLSGALLDKKLAYWKKHLEGTTLLELPTDFERPLVKSTRGALLTFTIDQELATELQKLSQQQGATLFMTLLSVFKILLFRYTGQEDICVGGAIAGRMQVEVESLVGFFVNALVLRSDLGGHPSFLSLLQQVRNNTLDAYEHQEVPFEKVVEAVVGERDVSKNPLFQVMFALQNTPPIPELRIGDVVMIHEPVKHTTSLFDLFWSIRERPDHIEVEIEYCLDLFKAESITRMFGHFVALLKSVVKDPAVAVGSLHMLSSSEEQQLKLSFNNTSLPYPADKNIVTLFEEQVAIRPDAPALIFGSEQLTYKQLNEKANQLGHFLRAKGVKEEVLVPMCVDRSTDLMVSILGILKAGGAYVPVDPGYPKDRIAYMLQDIGGNVAVIHQEHADILKGARPEVELICIDQDNWQEGQPTTALATSTTPDSLAYVIYTSGSTGRPKGTLVTHRNVTSLATGGNFVSLSAEDVLLSTGSPSFDATTIEYWGMLLNGGQLILFPEKQLLDQVLLKQEIRLRGVTKMWFTASWFNQLIDDDISIFDGLKAVMAGGEKLSETHILKFQAAHPDIDVINGYGPTENTTFSLTHNIRNLREGERIPIGRPLGNRTAYVLNTDLQLMPVGVPGELYVGGAGVSRGYLHQDALTTERFIADPFSELPGARLYKTGDRARWLPDGTVEYLGRIDDQVKIRGFRIEPGEIERVLNNLDEVASNCVVVKEAGTGKRLVGYFIPENNVIRQKESELYLQQVETWNELYETAYSKAEEVKDLDHEFNITGWNDSFTGGASAIPAEQMREWLDDISQLILSGNPQRVLEIGSGTGLIYFQLAEHIQKYIGTDFSRVSMGQLQQYINKGKRKYPDTDLKLCAAHEVVLDENESIDHIILNSIVQYFPGEQYLTSVVEKCISLLKGKGRIIMGDIRDLRLLPSFKGRLQLAKLQDRTRLKEFEWNVDQEVTKEEELCISPAFFYALQERFPEITHIDIQWKQGDAINELTLYRYTAIIYVGTEQSLLHPAWHVWDDIADKGSIISQLGKGHDRIALKDVPNPRLWKERLLAEVLETKPVSVNTVGDLIDYLVTPDHGTRAVNELLAEAKAAGYKYRFLLDEDPLKINLLLERTPFTGFVEQVYYNGADRPTGNKTNIPLFPDICANLQKDLRLKLLDRLPEYMVPSELVALQYLPLTSNGKVDRKFLSDWEDIERKRLINYEAPATAAEIKLADIWQRLLSVERVGLHDNFFELGGHSLLATRVVSAVRKDLEVELSVKDFFIYPTVGKLAAYLADQKKGLVLPAIVAEERPERTPLSYSQERLWFIDQLEGSVQYHMPAVFRLKGQLDIAALDHALHSIVQRHEVLRTLLEHQQGAAYQRVLTDNTWKLTVTENDHYSQDPFALQSHITSLTHAPFDLANDYMLRAELIRLSADEYILVLVMHHIASDGWSVSVVVKELIEGYRARTSGREPVLEKLPVQYADYAIWQRRWLTGEVLDKQLDYWKEQLGGTEVLNLPTDYQRPAVQSTRGAMKWFSIDNELLRQVQQLAQQQGTTLFMTLLATFKVLLHRYSGQEDICVGTSIAGRTREELEGLIGFFVNTLALRSSVDREQSFIALLQQVKRNTLGAYEHQEVPFEKVVEAVVKDRDLGRNPLFQVMFELQNTPEVPVIDLGEVQLLHEEMVHTTTQFDLTISMEESPEGLKWYAEYSIDLFSEETINRMMSHFEHLLRAVVKSPAIPVGALPMLSPVEKHELLIGFNDTETAYPSKSTFVDLFEAQAARTPAAIALVLDDTFLTYKELDERANQLAYHLSGKGVTTDMLVPVCIERSLDMIVAIMGILKAGGAYVPVDPEYPTERLRYILEDTDAALVVGSSYGKQKINATGADITFVALDDDAALLASLPVQSPAMPPTPHQLAYVIYTSGSTGRPKGVMVEHKGMLNHLYCKINDLKMNDETVLAYTATYTFDISVWQMFAALLTGGRTIVYTEEHIYRPVELLRSVAQHKVSILELVPSYLSSLLQEDVHIAVPHLQFLLVTGEAVTQQLLAQWFSHASFGTIPVVNAYGPTEASDDITHYIMHNTPSRSNVPLGKPIQNMRIYILDPSGELCPIGVPGEICVAGVGVSRGYLNNPALTAQKFIRDQFSTDSAHRTYRTGDLGRWLPDGNIEYLGRIDEQVKIRGYRIELGEIENVLLQSEQVKEAVVMARALNAESIANAPKHLVGYIVPEGDFDKEAIIAYAKEKLPEYMVPDVFIQLESLPLSANGKVDRKALPSPEHHAAMAATYIAPGNEIEQKLADICCRLLELERVGVQDHLFELGMHSLLLMRLVAAVQEEFGIKIPVKTFFKFTTIEALARYIKVSDHSFAPDADAAQTIRL